MKVAGSLRSVPLFYRHISISMITHITNGTAREIPFIEE